MKANYLFVLTAVIIVLSGCSQNIKEPVYDLHIKDVTIIDEKGKPLKARHLFIQNDTIAAILSEEKAPLPTAKSIISKKDHYLMLGLWDNHVHFRGGETLIEQNKTFLDTYLAYGVTTVRDAGGDLTPEVMLWNRQQKKGALAGPTIFTSGPKIDGPKARWAGSIAVNNSGSIEKALDSLQAIGVDYVKLYDSTIDGQAYLNTIAAAEKRGMITSGHMPFSVSLSQTIIAGIDNIEHLYYILKGCSSKEAEVTEQISKGEISFWESMEVLIASYDPNKAQSLFKMLKENDVCVTPTLHIGNVLSYLDEVDHSNDPELEGLTQAYKATYQGRINSALSASAKAKENRKALQAFFSKLTQNLNQAGVCLLAGSDAGAYNSYVYPGISIHKELEQLVAAGLTPAEALQTMAYNGSRFLKRNGYQMKTGHRADLVLLSNNPLEDITHTQNITHVIKDGKVVKQ